MLFAGSRPKVCRSALRSPYLYQNWMQSQNRKRAFTILISTLDKMGTANLEPPGFQKGRGPFVKLRRSAAAPRQFLLGGSTPLFFAQLRRMGSRSGQTGGHRQNHSGHTWPRRVKSNLPPVGKRQTSPPVCFAVPQQHVPGQTCQYEQRADDAVAQQICMCGGDENSRRTVRAADHA